MLRKDGNSVSLLSIGLDNIIIIRNLKMEKGQHHFLSKWWSVVEEDA